MIALANIYLVVCQLTLELLALLFIEVCLQKLIDW